MCEYKKGNMGGLEKAPWKNSGRTSAGIRPPRSTPQLSTTLFVESRFVVVTAKIPQTDPAVPAVSNSISASSCYCVPSVHTCWARHCDYRLRRRSPISSRSPASSWARECREFDCSQAKHVLRRIAKLDIVCFESGYLVGS